MKRILSIAGSLLGLLVLGVLAVALALSFGGLGRGAEPASQAFQSPIETPTQPPYPIPATPTHPPSKPTPVTPPPTIPPKPSPPTVTVTLPPYPPPQTPTPPGTPTAVPTPRATVTLPAPGTPTAVPTPSGPLPPGLKVVYAETAPDGTVTFWAASAVNPERRQILTTADPARFGVHATLSHDGSWLAYTFTPSSDRFAAELWVVRLDGTGRRLLASGVDVGAYVNYPIWSPDDRYVAVRHQVYRQAGKTFPYDQVVSAIDVHTGEEIPLIELSVSNLEEDYQLWISPLDWSPDGRHLYYQLGATGHVELWRVDVVTHAREYVGTIAEGGAPRCYFFSPDGQWLLCTNQVVRKPPQYAVVLVPTGPGQIETIISGASDELYNPIWHPSGREVTINLPPQANEQAELRSINVQTRHKRTIAFAEEGIFIPRAWSPDGQWVAVQKFPGTNRDLLLVSHDGVQVHRISTAGGLEFIGWFTGDLPGETR